MAAPWSVRLFTPLPGRQPLDECAFSPWQTQVTISSGRPGGYLGASVGFAEMPISLADGWPYLPRPVFVQDLSHCEIYCGTTLVFEGRVIETDTGGERATGLRVEGYSLKALSDAPWYPPTNSEDPTYYTSGRLILQAMADTCPLVPPIQRNDFGDPGILHTYAEVQGKTVAQMVQQFSTEGNGAALWDMQLWENRRPVFLPRLSPSLPTYREDLDRNVPIQRTSGDLVGSVYVRYTDVVTNAPNQLVGPFTDVTFAGRNGGLLVTKEIPGGTMSSAGATAFGRTYLAKYSQPIYRVQFTRDGWRGLRLPSGAFRSPWLVRCDEWAQVGDLPMLPIVRADVNCTSGTMVCQLGDPPANGLELTRQLQRVARTVQQNVNSNTYARN